MGFVAEASLDSSASPEAHFDRLANLDEWKNFMPRSFTLMRGKGTMKVGDRLKVRITGLPSIITVSTMNRPNEIAWTGGKRGVLYAEHRFVFEEGRIRSIETWEGALSGFLKPLLKRGAERVGKQQLRALALGL